MIRELIGLWRTAAQQCLRDCLRGVVTATAAALFAIVSLGFATFAAYVQLGALAGPAEAALIIGVAYGLIALGIWTIGIVRRRAARTRRAAASALAPDDWLLESFTVTGSPKYQWALMGAMRLAQEVSAMQLLALTLALGFIAGRKLRK